MAETTTKTTRQQMLTRNAPWKADTHRYLFRRGDTMTDRAFPGHNVIANLGGKECKSFKQGTRTIVKAQAEHQPP